MDTALRAVQFGASLAYSVSQDGILTIIGDEELEGGCFEAFAGVSNWDDWLASVLRPDRAKTRKAIENMGAIRFTLLTIELSQVTTSFGSARLDNG